MEYCVTIKDSTDYECSNWLSFRFANYELALNFAKGIIEISDYIVEIEPITDKVANKENEE